MTALTNVGRYHVVQRFNFLILPWVAMSCAFAIDVVILALTPAGNATNRYVGGVAAMFAIFFVNGLLSVARSLPFGLTLGVSRRSYFLGTTLLAASLAAANGLALAGLQAIERASGGWGLSMWFFRVPYLLDGPWYLTWLTSFVFMMLLFAYGMWCSLVYRRWGVIGLVTFVVGQVTVFVLGAVIATWASAWHAIGQFFTDLSAAGLTGVLLAGVAVLLAGGFATVRRIAA